MTAKHQRKKPRLIVIGPVPPPYHGVSVAIAAVLRNEVLARRFDVEHLDTTDRREDLTGDANALTNLGRWDLRNVVLALGAVIRLGRRLGGDRGIVYVPFSQNVPALVRDTIFIHLAALRRWTVVGHLHGGQFREFYERQPKLIRRWLRGSLGRLASVGVLGSSLLSQFEGLVPASRLAVIPNGTQDVDFDGTRRDPEAGLFLGSLRLRKGVVEAVEAALLVLREHPSARFTFVGEWWDHQLERTLRDRARQAGGRIEFSPPLVGPAKRDIMAAAAFFLFPPVEPEGQPLVVLEALAAGLPVVATDRGAIAETVVDDESGFIVADPVPEELASRMLRLLRDQELRERMSRSARARYLEQFTQERAGHRMADWLEAVPRAV